MDDQIDSLIAIEVASGDTRSELGLGKETGQPTESQVVNKTASGDVAADGAGAGGEGGGGGPSLPPQSSPACSGQQFPFPAMAQQGFAQQGSFPSFFEWISMIGSLQQQVSQTMAQQSQGQPLPMISLPNKDMQAHTEAGPTPRLPANPSVDPLPPIGHPFVTPDGILSLILRNSIRIDITVSSIRVYDLNTQAAAALNTYHWSAGIIHPSGRVYQEGSVIDIETGHRMAKISPRGVTFTSQSRSLVYLVDKSGCKSTTERFRKSNYDYTMDIFYKDVISGATARQRSMAEISRGSYQVTGGTKPSEIWEMAGFKIQLKPNGDVLITQYQDQTFIFMSPSSGQMRVNTCQLKATLTFDPNNFLQVLKPNPNDLTKSESRVRATSEGFVARHGLQQAGFDGSDNLVLK